MDCFTTIDFETATGYRKIDGLEITGYLTSPVGKDDKNLPTIILVHGGIKGSRDN